MYFNLSKKKGEAGFTTELMVQFKFNRKIPIMAYSFDLERTPLNEKKEVENERLPLPKMPNNRAYLYVYGYNMNNETKIQMNY